MSVKIIVKIPRKGISTNKSHPTVEADGVVGNACTTLTAAFHQAMGTVRTDEAKAELYEDVPQQTERIDTGN